MDRSSFAVLVKLISSFSMDWYGSLMTTWHTNYYLACTTN